MTHDYLKILINKAIPKGHPCLGCHIDISPFHTQSTMVWKWCSRWAGGEGGKKKERERGKLPPVFGAVFTRGRGCHLSPRRVKCLPYQKGISASFIVQLRIIFLSRIRQTIFHHLHRRQDIVPTSHHLQIQPSESGHHIKKNKTS
ncbi:unnamed protein product [Lactuca saligna]|uniref:Uncharacterized protein n=1 Tax=Lactuca saligna TaxID=75948 RepID=A0AA35V6R2_LACSI|nr:unnamed protein product [Lactuca saligna]